MLVRGFRFFPGEKTLLACLNFLEHSDGHDNPVYQELRYPKVGLGALDSPYTWTAIQIWIAFGVQLFETWWFPAGLRSTSLFEEK